MPDEPENLPISLFHSFDNDYAKDVLIEMSDSLLESATKAVTNSDALVKIPIVGGVIAVGKGIVDMRDRLFISKLLRMLAEVSNLSDDAKKKFQEKLDKDPKMAAKSGAILLDLIDKATGAEKAAMIGKVVRAFMHEGEIGHAEMIGLCEMIDKAYLSDLQALARKDGEPGPPWNDINLEGVGIKKSMRSEDVNNAIQASIDQTTRKIPIIHEQPQNPIVEIEPKVAESGFTDAGSMLRRILREY